MSNKKGMYSIILIILLVLYILFQNTFFGTLFFVYGGMGCVSVGIAKVLSKRVEIKLQCDTSHIEVGSKIYIGIITKNSSWFPTNKMFVKLVARNHFFRKEPDECLLNVPVSIHGEEEITSTIECKYVGNIRIRLKTIVLSDYFGLVSYEIPCDQVVDVDVMPQDIEVKLKLSVQGEEDDESNTDAIDSLEAYDIKEVREYRDGESLHRIHWNLSSRYDEYMIKEYEVETVPRYNIMLDMAGEKVELINEIIEGLCGAVKLVSTLEREFSVHWFDAKTEVVKEMIITDKSDINRLLDEVYATTMSKVAGEVYYRINDELSDKINAIYVTAKSDSVPGEIIGEVCEGVVLMRV